MQPFTKKFLFAALAFTVAYAGAYFIPEFQLIPDILIRSSVFTILFAAIILGLKISADINETVVQFFRKK